MEAPKYPKDLNRVEETTPLQDLLNGLNAELPQGLEATEVTKPLNEIGFTGLTGTCAGCEKDILLPEFATKNNGLIKYFCEECETINKKL